MITELCLELHNWFDQKRIFGTFKVEDGVLTYLDGELDIKDGQYYRIIESVFNDGVHKHGSETLVDEVFSGAIWLMAVPRDVINLASEISLWQSKYGGAESMNMSPFQSESFNQYSYSKGSVSASSASSVPTWQSVFADRMRRYRKI